MISIDFYRFLKDCREGGDPHIPSFFTNGQASGVLATAALKSINRLRKIENGRKFKKIRNQRLRNQPSQQKKFRAQKSFF